MTKSTRTHVGYGGIVKIIQQWSNVRYHENVTGKPFGGLNKVTFFRSKNETCESFVPLLVSNTFNNGGC